MQGIELNTAKGILELYEHFNKGGQWKPRQVQLMNDFRGNAVLECEVSKNAFGGPYLDTNERGFSIWEIPIKVNDYAFSWQLLARELFARFDIPHEKFDNGCTYPKNYQEFSKILNKETKNGKGKKFIYAVSKKEEKLAKILFNKLSGIEYNASHPHNREGRPFLKGDKISAVVNLRYAPIKELNKSEHTIIYGLRQTQDYDFLRKNKGLIIPSGNVNAIIRRM